MKVIDLLNKIANGEEAPKQIYYEGDTYNLINNGRYDWYQNDNDSSGFLDNVYRIKDFLNDEVEIIEEEKEIEEISLYLRQEDYDTKRNINYHNENLKILTNIINELIDETKKLKEGK